MPMPRATMNPDLAFAVWSGERQRRIEDAAGSRASFGRRGAAAPSDASCRARRRQRIRPLLAYAAGELTSANCSGRRRRGRRRAWIHAYSLVHDDLPCMDDDVLRRGKPTCHVAFGEATALLAGDALQALAFDALACGGLQRQRPRVRTARDGCHCKCLNQPQYVGPGARCNAQTNRTQKSQITDGTRGHTVKAASNVAAGTDTAFVVRLTADALPTGTNSIGQVMANAGTNLDTSALALENGNLSSLQTGGLECSDIPVRRWTALYSTGRSSRPRHDCQGASAIWHRSQ